MRESVPKDSTGEKERQYSEHENVIGFKEDFRCIYGHEDEEFDLSTAEAYHPAKGIQKAVNDRSKLLREGKVTSVSLCKIIKDNSNITVKGWIIHETYGVVPFFGNNSLLALSLFLLPITPRLTLPFQMFPQHTYQPHLF
ncbi:MAG: hypothetical protein EXX96DRAFT_616181 [Benjaminiella poitrasii]|nr:MAG: hypothetical protein EXX96DRAFT_616181 [Benjaminiella poitrasii]